MKGDQWSPFSLRDSFKAEYTGAERMIQTEHPSD